MASVRTMTCLKCDRTTANALDIVFRYCGQCHEYRPYDGVIVHEPDDTIPRGGRAPLPRIPTVDIEAARARLKRPSGSPTRKPSDKAPDPPETSTH